MLRLHGKKTPGLSGPHWAVLVAASVAFAACGNVSASDSVPLDQAKVLRLGFQPNLAHTPAIVAIKDEYFARALGPGITLKTQSFNAGPAETEALIGGSLDAAFLGPTPAVTAFNRSRGGVTIISGVASGGAALVARNGSGITSVASLKGKKIATPQLGNTQDIALRAYLKSHGLRTDLVGGGDVQVTPSDNATILLLFRQGSIDAAWVPEPWVARLVAEAGGRVVLDEASTWPDGKYPTTNLVISNDYLAANPGIVKHLLSGLLQGLAYVNSNPSEAKALVNQAFVDYGGKKLAAPVLDAAWARLNFTADPLPAQLKKDASDAGAVGVLKMVDVSGIYDLRPLNALLRARGNPTYGSAGLGPS